VLNALLFDSLAETKQTLEDWRIEYNKVRARQSLDKKTPLAYPTKVVNV
jgi:transposase InsO family protein